MKRNCGDSFAHIVSVVALLLAGLIYQGIAQGTGSPLPYATVQDTLHLLRIFGGDTVPASHFAPSYHYEMVYDSISHTNYMFTECRRNGENIKLLHWEYNRLVHGPAEYLTYNSRTADFPIQPGDTLSFYRELRWYNPLTRRQDTNNYYALDTLDFSVHLIRTSDGEPIMLLDSIGVLPRLPIGAPAVYGARPLMAVVRYVVPAGIVADSAFIGVTARTRGSGRYDFTRLDLVTIGVSERLKDAYYQEYLNIYGRVYGKRNVDELATATGRADSRLVVRPDGSSVHIRFAPAPDGGLTAVAIYDASGTLIFYPYNGRTSEPETTVSYRLPGSGVYFVLLQHDGRIIQTEKITITN